MTPNSEMKETKRGHVTHALMISLGTSLAAIGPARAAEDPSADLARKLSNPIASLISVPVKVNWDTGIGSAGADRFTFLFQPVAPFSLSDDWNLITRTIVPYIDTESPVIGGGSEAGLGDITQSFFFSPKAPTDSGWVWGAGPVFLYPTATNGMGSGKWGAGLTAVALRQSKGWTTGILANHIWSFAGRENRGDVSLTFLQPFVSYTTKGATTFSLNTESTYDWSNEQWTVPVNVSVSQLVVLDTQPISLSAGARTYLERPENGPDWGLSFTVTLLFPT